MMRKIMPHLSIVFSIIMITLFIINRINPAMGFLKGNVFETFLLIYISVSLLSAIVLLISNKRRWLMISSKLMAIKLLQLFLEIICF